MDAELSQKLQELEMKIDEIRGSVKKMQRYFQITFWITVIFFVLPLVGLLFVLPKAMNSYLGSMNIDNLQGLEGL